MAKETRYRFYEGEVEVAAVEVRISDDGSEAANILWAATDEVMLQIVRAFREGRESKSILEKLLALPFRAAEDPRLSAVDIEGSFQRFQRLKSGAIKP